MRSNKKSSTLYIVNALNNCYNRANSDAVNKGNIRVFTAINLFIREGTITYESVGST